MVLLRFLGGSVRVLIFISLVLWVKIVINLDKEGDRHIFELGSLTFLIYTVLLKVKDITDMC